MYDQNPGDACYTLNVTAAGPQLQIQCHSYVPPDPPGITLAPMAVCVGYPATAMTCGCKEALMKGAGTGCFANGYTAQTVGGMHKMLMQF